LCLAISQQPEPPQPKWFDLQRRGVWIAIFFATFVIVMVFAALIPVDPTIARTTTNELRNQAQYTATVDLIFGHNFFLTLIMFLPFIGPIFGVFSSFSTGIVVGDIAFVRSANPEWLVAQLFLAPHTYLELFAYSLAMSQSIFLSIAIARGQFRQELVRTCVIMAICALVLVVAAFFEVLYINLV
jgi:hypothetical protein